jgi:hypothetical protein
VRATAVVNWRVHAALKRAGIVLCPFGQSIVGEQHRDGVLLASSTARHNVVADAPDVVLQAVTWLSMRRHNVTVTDRVRCRFRHRARDTSLIGTPVESFPRKSTLRVG